MSAPCLSVIAGGVSETDAASFQTVRPRLLRIAYRVLRNASEADDVVQDAWIRWQGTDRTVIRDPGAFLTTMTSRLALTVGQSARVRREISTRPLEVDAVDPGADPSRVAEQAEALELALLALLEKLPATERAAYLLREAFDYPHRRIAELLGLSEANARQLVTRARGHLRGERCRPVGAADRRRLLAAFAAAARTGDLARLERLLVTDIVEEGHRELTAA
ncbi:MAG TPA: sigma-70 family RNA polymerase sigma factor [Solirubrobacteraceae bacterium]|nr:sigma-70 family RNA polymerase sigma factor [Solirubrobacteraceae bacterium]